MELEARVAVEHSTFRGARSLFTIGSAIVLVHVDEDDVVRFVSLDRGDCPGRR